MYAIIDHVKNLEEECMGTYKDLILKSLFSILLSEIEPTELY